MLTLRTGSLRRKLEARVAPPNTRRVMKMRMEQARYLVLVLSVLSTSRRISGLWQQQRSAPVPLLRGWLVEVAHLTPVAVRAERRASGRKRVRRRTTLTSRFGSPTSSIRCDEAFGRARWNRKRDTVRAVGTLTVQAYTCRQAVLRDCGTVQAEGRMPLLASATGNLMEPRERSARPHSG